DLVRRRHGEGALLRAFDLADRGEDVALDPGVLVVGDLAELEAHLPLEELAAERAVVVHLRLGSLDHLVEHEAKAADEDRIKDEHGPRQALSSLSRILTKL